MKPKSLAVAAAALLLLSSPALAQAPTDQEIAETWAQCADYKVSGKLGQQVPWRAGKPSYCTDELYAAWLKSAPAIEAKAKADAQAARDAKAADVVKRLPKQ